MLNFKQKIVQVSGPIGGYALSRWLTRSTPKILMYHRFSEKPCYGYVHREMFEKQVDYLHRYFNVISLGELISHIIEQRVLPVSTVVITVDDGYHDFYDIAYAILKKNNMPATFFVATRFVDGDFWLWPDQVRYILENSSAVDLQSLPGIPRSKYNSLNNESEQGLLGVIIAYLLSLEEVEKKRWLDLFAEKQGVVLPKCPEECYKAVSWGQVKELHANNIEIGAHSRTHPSLSRVHKDNLMYELRGSFDDIVEHVGHAPRSFCYPNGQPYDYTDTIKKLVRNVGFLGAVTAFYDRDITDDMYELRRFGANESWFEFLKAVNGIEVLTAKLLGADNIMSADNIVNEVMDL